METATDEPEQAWRVRLATLPGPHRRLVERILRLAPRLARPVYLVGGVVRDLLLGALGRDLDLVVEGDGPSWARALAREIGGEVREHREFLTAAVDLGQGATLDVATARTELYRSPARLPEVSPGEITADLARRDFTVNAMAVRLWPAPAPVLIDPFGGLRDLNARRLRVLHERSFVDDPTRLPRGVGLEARLGFRFDETTLEAWRRACELGALDALSGSRLRSALGLLFGDAGLLPGAVRRLGELGFLRGITPELELSGETIERLESAAEAVRRWPDLAPALERAAWLVLAHDLPASARRHLATRLDLQGKDAEGLVSGPERLRAAEAVLRSVRPAPHVVVAALESLVPEERLACWATEPAGRGLLERYFDEWRALELTIGGEDLLRAGVPAGPALGNALREVRAARIDGKISAAEELSEALRWLRPKRDDSE